MLSNIASEMLRILIHHEDEFITVKKMADMMEISERSVSTYMNEVSEFCKREQYTLIRKRGKGIMLNPGLRRKELEELISQKEARYEIRCDRVNYIIQTLIANQDVYTISQLADELYVSKSTVAADIE